MKLLLAVILVPFAGLLVLVLAYKLVFLCLSRRGAAIVTHTALHQQEDSEGYLNRHYRISIRYDVAGCSYEAEGFQELVDYPVGSEVSIRYHRNNPQDVHLGYWSSLCLDISSPIPRLPPVIIAFIFTHALQLSKIIDYIKYIFNCDLLCHGAVTQPQANPCLARMVPAWSSPATLSSPIGAGPLKIPFSLGPIPWRDAAMFFKTPCRPSPHKHVGVGVARIGGDIGPLDQKLQMIVVFALPAVKTRTNKPHSSIDSGDGRQPQAIARLGQKLGSARQRIMDIDQKQGNRGACIGNEIQKRPLTLSNIKRLLDVFKRRLRMIDALLNGGESVCLSHARRRKTNRKCSENDECFHKSACSLMMPRARLYHCCFQ